MTVDMVRCTARGTSHLLERFSQARMLYVAFKTVGLTVQQWAIMAIKFLDHFVSALCTIATFQQFAAIQV